MAKESLLSFKIKPKNMIKLGKTELIELSKVYFEKNKDLQKMIVTEDGNFFYVNHDHYAYSHARARKLKTFEIRRDDVFPAPIKEAKVTDEMIIAELRIFAEKNGIELGKSIKKSDIIETINNS